MLSLPLRQLDQANQLFRAEMKKSEAVRIDIFSKDSARAVDLIQNALKARGNHLIVDALAVDRLKKKQRSEYVFFIENMTGDEIGQMLEQLGADDKKLETKTPGDGLFKQIVLFRFETYHLIKLAEMLGLPKNRIPLKSSAPVTLNQLNAIFPKASASSGPKLALLLSTDQVPQNYAQTSKEIKNFLEKRTERKANTLPTMLILTTIN
jgi:hypothetical protein